VHISRGIFTMRHCVLILFVHPSDCNAGHLYLNILEMFFNNRQPDQAGFLSANIAAAQFRWDYPKLAVSQISCMPKFAVTTSEDALLPCLHFLSAEHLISRCFVIIEVIRTVVAVRRIVSENVHCIVICHVDWPTEVSDCVMSECLCIFISDVAVWWCIVVLVVWFEWAFTSAARCATSVLCVHLNRLVELYETVISSFASAAVSVDSSHMTVLSSTSWSRSSPSSHFVNGHVSTI